MSPSFRFAGLRKPATKPKVEVVKLPVWELNSWSNGASERNDPIFHVNSNAATFPASASVGTVGVTEQVYHYQLPGTAYLLQAADASMNWALNSFFAFKCYFKLNSASGRIPIFSRRNGINAGGPFIEVRDGKVVAGWYDTKLKKEVWIETSKAIVEPGFVYYLYYRKWFPRGTLSGSTSMSYYGGGNWYTSTHRGGSAASTDCYDSLVVRRVPKDSRYIESDYDGWCGYDLKSFTKIGSPKIFYDWYANFSSPRACVSFVPADANYGTAPARPYEGFGGVNSFAPSGCVMYRAQLDKASSTGDLVAITNTAFSPRFLLDHVGMLLQIDDDTAFSAVNGRTYRIIEMIDCDTVRVKLDDNSVPVMPVWGGGTNQYISVYPDVSLVKSPDYDAALDPDANEYAIEVFGSSLAGDPLSGISQFDGRGWSFAWGIFTTISADPAGYLVREPDIFEDASVARAAGGGRLRDGIEVGTDVFGLQGGGAPYDGSLPMDGWPLGEIQVDATFARTAVDTMVYAGAAPWAFAGPLTTTAPGSTQPNSALAIALSTGGGAALSVEYTRETGPGRRRIRLSYYDPDHDEEGEVGDEVSFQIQADDGNPAARVDLVLSQLPMSTEWERTVWRRVRMSLDGSGAFYVASDIKDASSSTATVLVDDIAMTELSDPLTTAELLLGFGAPPRARYVAISGGRLVAAGLSYAPESFAYSRPGDYDSFPLANVLPTAAGDGDITGMVDMLGSAVVFKRGAVLAYDLSQAVPVLARQSIGDGCTSNNSIVALEDRIYYMSDRGPMVLLSDFSPFFVGWRVQGLMKRADRRSLDWSASGVNRSRGQIIMSFEIDGVPSAIGIEFTHPMEGEDTLRAELIAGHRFAFYQGPDITAAALLQRDNDGEFLTAVGTADGFVVWTDRKDTQLSMRGDKLEGNLGSVGDGSLASRWSTKDMDVDYPELDKVVHYLDVSKPEGLSGTLYLTIYRNRSSTPIASNIPIDLSEPFSTIELASALQESRSFRLVFGLEAGSGGTIWELLDLTIRQQLVDSR